MDLEHLTKWIYRNATTLWKHEAHIYELQTLAYQCEFFQCVHVYRDADDSAEFLSTQSHRQDIIQDYYTENQLPNVARGSFLLDKWAYRTLEGKS